MNRTIARLAALFLAMGLVGCNAFGPNDGEDSENEVRVTVLALGASYLDANDGLRYEITAKTVYEGFTSFADVTVGAEVDIEFEEIPGSNNRTAIEIEDPTAPDDG